MYVCAHVQITRWQKFKQTKRWGFWVCGPMGFWAVGAWLLAYELMWAEGPWTDTLMGWGSGLMGLVEALRARRRGAVKLRRFFEGSDL